MSSSSPCRGSVSETARVVEADDPRPVREPSAERADLQLAADVDAPAASAVGTVRVLRIRGPANPWKTDWTVVARCQAAAHRAMKKEPK